MLESRSGVAPTSRSLALAPSPFVSVIVPVWNDEGRLRLCLSALESQTYPAFEVIVVDNGSQVAPDVSAFPRARLVREQQPGSYAARNRGLQEARGRVLAFTDADCLPAREWLERGVTLLTATPGVGMVGGPVQLFPQVPGKATASELYDIEFGFPQVFYARGGFSVTANLITTRAVMDEVGPFNAELKSHGDREWGMRASAAGHRLVFDEQVLVRHPARRFRELVSKERRKAGGAHGTWRRGDASQRLSLRAVFRPYVRSSWRRTAKHPLRARLAVMGVLMCIHVVYVGERVRLLLGGGPRR